MNLADLRKIAEAVVNRTGSSEERVKNRGRYNTHLDPPTVLALLDVAEAARVAIPTSACDVDGACGVECGDGCVRLAAFAALARLEELA